MEEKPCSKCGLVKALAEFHKQPRGKFGRMANCKLCHDIYNNVWRKANPEAWKRAKRIAERAYRERLRSAAVAYLGGSCVGCGSADLRVLQIDHVDGGGGKESRSIGANGVYRRVVQGLGSYQLLCANCNWIKRHENGETVQQIA